MSEPACPRCAGLVANLYDDPHCLNCGWRRCEPVQRNQIEREVIDEGRPLRRRGRKSSMTVEERKERNRQYMRAYWERKKKGVKPRAYVKRKAAQG